MKKPVVKSAAILVLISLLFLSVSLPDADDSVQAVNVSQEDAPTVDSELLSKFDRSDSVGYMIYFDEEADLSAAYSMSWEERGDYVYETLTALAEETQVDVRSYLDQQGVDYEAFWIDNVIAVDSSSQATLEGLLTYTEIDSITVIHEIQLEETVDLEVESEESETRSAESNLTHINADDVWALGYTGTDIVVGNIDTGVNYTHEALVDQYRGNNGDGTFDHDYSWLDAIDSETEPYDDHYHGTHTMGIMVGDDGNGNQIGVAPDAEWIACKAFNGSGGATDASLLACGQFMLAPTDTNGENADTDMRPHIVNNSWGDCGQTYNDWYQDTIDAWQAAGIYPVFSAGNAGNCGYSYPPGLNTVGNPARAGNVTAVGSTGKSNGEYATHSNWGPTDDPDTVNPEVGYEDMKPQVVAPGVSIRSSLGDSYGDDGYGNLTGTSMAAPHVAGLIALIWDAAPDLIGDYASTETLLQESANPILYDDGYGERSPNYATGWGEIDAEVAVLLALGGGLLKGRTYDVITDRSIYNATIEADAQGNPDNDRSGMTDEDGFYMIIANVGETYDLITTADGYESTTEPNVELASPGTIVKTNFELEYFSYIFMPFLRR